MYNKRVSFLCFDPSDLVPDGYIDQVVEREFLPPSSFNPDWLNSRALRGITYETQKDSDGNITYVKEKRKTSPAKKIRAEINFNKYQSDPTTPMIDITKTYLGNSWASVIATPLLAPIGEGGFVDAYTHKTFQILDSETKVNHVIEATEEILKTGIIEFEGFPLAVFGVVKGHEKEDGSIVGLEFNDDEVNNIGRYHSGVFQGSRVKNCKGAVDSNGLFGGLGLPDVLFEDVKFEDQEQLFIEVVKDPRKIKFRADNGEETSAGFPFRISGQVRLDGTDNKIRIKTKRDDDTPLFEVGDKLFITFLMATKRYVRENLTHHGRTFHDRSYAGVGFTGTVLSRVSSWGYRLHDWDVPSLPEGVSPTDTEAIIEFCDESESYKLTPDQYLGRNVDNYISGWRLSYGVFYEFSGCWAADYRGIIFYDAKKRTSSLIIPKSLILDQRWFEDYLRSAPFTSPSGPDGSYVESDYDVLFDTYIREEMSSTMSGVGQLFYFDTSRIVNSLLFDKEKVPYYGPFAESLKKVSKYDGSSDKGIGAVQLDLRNVGADGYDLQVADLSYTDFCNLNMVPTKESRRDDPNFVLDSSNYYSENYDEAAGGPGAWVIAGQVDQGIYGWAAPGQYRSTFWKMQTPFYCDNFTRKTRIFMEQEGGAGGSLDVYSWIFADTDVTYTSEISCDVNIFTGESFLAYKDEDKQKALVWNKLEGLYFNTVFSLSELDYNYRNENLNFYTYLDFKRFFIGANRIIGSIPDYSHGVLIRDRSFDENNNLKEIDLLTEPYNFKFDDSSKVADWASELNYSSNSWEPIPNIPQFSGWRLDLPRDARIRNIMFVFDNKDGKFTEKIGDGIMGALRGIISLYFGGTEYSITDYRISYNTADEVHCLIDCSLYGGSPVYIISRLFNDYPDTSYIKNIYVSYFEESNPDSVGINENLDNSIVDSSQTSIVYGNDGIIYIFFYDEDDGNIGVVLSKDSGVHWDVHRDILILLENEEVSNPFVVSNDVDDSIDLFYVLNGKFLMKKIINTGLFDEQDKMIRMKRLEKYDMSVLSGDSESDFSIWGDEFSDVGKELRVMPSFFVAGNKDDEFFIEETEVSAAMIENNQESGEVNYYPRYLALGNFDNMDMDFLSYSYVIFDDPSGIRRLVFCDDEGMVFIKIPTGENEIWVTESKEINMHRTFVDPELERSVESGIRNLQIIKDPKNTSDLAFLYFNNGMLFLRYFSYSQFFSEIDEDGNSYMPEVDLSRSTNNRPIFITGEMPRNIKDIVRDEQESGVSSADSKLYIYVPYGADVLYNFNEYLSVDDETRPYGRFLNNNMIRIFYKDFDYNLNGIVLDNMASPSMDLMRYIPCNQENVKQYG